MFGPLISVLAVILGLVLVGPISPANAGSTAGNNNDCVPSDAVAASFSPWAIDHSTTWSTSNTAPADPDGESGDDNPLNLQQVGAMDQKSVQDKAAWDETVVDSAAVLGQHYSLKGNSGIGADEVPPVPTANNVGPRGIWEANAAEEPDGHYNTAQEPDGSTYAEGDSGLHYTSAGSSGLRDWFFYQAPVAEKSHVVHHDAVSHTEYSWAIEKRTYTPAKDAVTCDDNPGGNNGSIKVDDDGLPGCNVGHSQGGDVCDNGVGNDPHLGCSFYVEWYNYEANATSTVTFSVQDPTGGTVTAVQGTVAPGTVQLDGDDASGANEAGFDGSELYQLTFTDAPQQNHGWHVQVTTHTTWSNGSDEKSKTFWVEGDCRVIPLTPTVTMDDQCGTANDSGPTYTAENDYWTTTEGDNTVVFHAKDGFYFPAGDNTSDGGKTYTVSYTPNTDVACPGEEIPLTPAVTMDDQCGTANDSGPTYTAENEYWTTTEGDNTVVFHAKDGFYFPAGDNTSEDGMTYTVSYTPNTDVPCEQVQDASAALILNTAQSCETGQSAAPGAISGATWNEGATTVYGPGSYNFVATAIEGYKFPAGLGVSGDGTTKTFSGTLLGSLAGTQGCTTTPEPAQRIVHQSEQSCELGGVHTWDDVYTTTYAWDEATGTYVGTETGPVAENDLLTPYTPQELEDLGCVEVEGEQTHGHHGGGKHHPEVKGEQAHAPAAAVVPTQVEAGLAGTPAGTPAGGGSNNLPLWVLSLGAGMFLIGAGRLRRTSRSAR